MTKLTLLERVKYIIIRVLPFLFKPKEKNVEGIVDAFEDIVLELEQLSENKEMEMELLSKAILDLEEEEAEATDQQIRAENVATKLRELSDET